MAIFLTIGILQFIQNPGLKAGSLLLLFVMQMGIGFLIGWVRSRLSLFLINRLKLGYQGLYPVLAFALVFSPLELPPARGKRFSRCIHFGVAVGAR